MSLGPPSRAATPLSLLKERRTPNPNLLPPSKQSDLGVKCEVDKTVVSFSNFCNPRKYKVGYTSLRFCCSLLKQLCCHTRHVYFHGTICNILKAEFKS